MIRHVNYKNEKYPVNISFYALEMLESEGLDLAGENDGANYKAIKRLFWHSLVAGHYHENKELTIKEDESVFILDYCFVEFQELMPLFLDELNKKNTAKAKN